MCWDDKNLFVIAGFISTLFYSNSAGLSDVFHYNGAFITAGFIIGGFHCTGNVFG